jgi:hypothetical protein
MWHDFCGVMHGLCEISSVTLCLVHEEKLSPFDMFHKLKCLTSEITMFLEVRDVDVVDSVVAAAMMVPVQAPVSACPID